MNRSGIAVSLGVGIATGAIASAQLAPLFTARFDVATDFPSPFLSKCVDLDGDGLMDILAFSATDTDATISWFRNRGGSPPTFERRVVAAKPLPWIRPAQTFDVDVDGLLDVVAAWAPPTSNGPTTLLWHRQNGAGGFDERPLATSAGVVNAIAVGRIGGAGVDVLALTTDTITDRVRLYSSADGGATWTDRLLATIPQGDLRSIDIADVNSDGQPDFVVASAGMNRVIWFEQVVSAGGGAPTFVQRVAFDGGVQPWNSADWIQSVVAADVNGDGRIDIVSASPGKGVRWHENLGPSGGGGPPEFAAHAVFARNAVSVNALLSIAVYVVDVDLDGHPDILSTSLSDSSLWLHRQLPQAAGLPSVFTIERISSDVFNPLTVSAADLDGDGVPDVVAAAAAAPHGFIRWFRNDLRTPDRVAFVAHQVEAQSANIQAVAAADFDADGRIDIVADGYLNIRRYKNLGGDPPIFAPSDVSPISGSLFTDIATADIDGDGLPDILTGSLFGTNVRWYRNLGGPDPSFMGYVVFEGAGAALILPGDLDGDGDVDVVSVAMDLRWNENKPGTTTRNLESSMFLGPGLVQGGHPAMADVDGDGHIDIVTSGGAPGGSRMLWLESDGATPPMFQTAHVIPFDGSVMCLTAGDLDGDGHVDISLATFTGIFWLHSDGGSPPAFTPILIATSFQEFVDRLRILDIDGDRDMDILCFSNSGRDPVRWYENIGPESSGGPTRFITRIISTTGLGHGCAADLDGDGDLDIAVPGPDGASILWLENLKPAYDMNHDGAIGSTDIALLLGNWGPCDPQSDCHADFNGDGQVGAADLALLLNHWGPRR